MTLTVHRGTRQIGGNCVEIATATTRIVLDIGLPLDRLISDGGKQDQSADEHILNVFRQSPPVKAVILSHAHADHTGLLSLAPANIPVYCSEGTSMMMKAGSVYARQKDVASDRKRILHERGPEIIGDITVTGHPVDHSAFGSMALEVEGEGRRVVYSGDLRLHGRKPGMAKMLVRSLYGKRVEVLMMEGTSLSRVGKAGPTEKELEEQILGDIKSAPGLVLASFSPMHVDRLVTFYRATKRAGRILALDHYAGFVLHLVSKISRVPAPRLGSNVLVFRPTFQKLIRKVALCFRGVQTSLAAILSEGERFVTLFRPSMLEADFHDGLPGGTRCIYSYWPGYLEGGDWQAAKTKLAEAGGQLIQRHTSGHIFAEHIGPLIRALACRALIPIHTEKPERFKGLHPNVVLLKDGQEFSLQ